MKNLARSSVLSALTVLSGCVVQSAMTLVAGATEVKITRNVAGITCCPAVGYIPAADISDLVDHRITQNETVALNGNTVAGRPWRGTTAPIENASAALARRSASPDSMQPVLPSLISHAHAADRLPTSDLPSLPVAYPRAPIRTAAY
jgi:hypothetical protein